MSQTLTQLVSEVTITLFSKATNIYTHTNEGSFNLNTNTNDLWLTGSIKVAL